LHKLRFDSRGDESKWHHVSQAIEIVDGMPGMTMPFIQSESGRIAFF